MYPKKTFPVNAPTAVNAVIQVASSIVIFPDGNGDSSEVRGIIVGDVQPSSSDGKEKNYALRGERKFGVNVKELSELLNSNLHEFDRYQNQISFRTQENHSLVLEQPLNFFKCSP